MTDACRPRDERRRRTEANILDAARELFADLGYERTTIRLVAAQAGVDPALVMQYYGSKEQLFAAAARRTKQHRSVVTASRDELPRASLTDLFDNMESEADREAVSALLRNCLTHPEAARIMRDEVMCERSRTIAATIGGEDAELRAGLMAACMIGVSVARYAMEIPAVAAASREDIERLMEPVLRVLVGPPDAAGPGSPTG
jgi:AcrR family transcriptional regulator